MKATEAWCWESPGEPNDLQRKTVELTSLGDRDVLIENRAIAFNPVDWKLMQDGHSDWRAGQIPGVDGMGTIEAVGKDAHHLRIGARVAYHTDLRKNGSFARHTMVPARAVMTVPETLSDVAAAGFPCPGLTAWQSLAKLPDLSGEALLIAGASGSVGRFATQLALQRRVRVFATANRKHHKWLLQLGVQAAVDYHDDNWVSQLRDANGGQPFAAIIDLVSSEQASKLVEQLGYYGHIVSVLGRVERNPQPLFTRCASLHEIALGAAHQFGSDRQWHQLVCAGEEMLTQLATGMLELPPTKIGKFDELPSHLDEFKSRGQGIKYVVTVN